MRIVDANVLLYAANEADPRHASSVAWVDAAMNGPEVVGLPWLVVLAFLRLSTKAGLFPRPLAIEAALARVREWLAQAPATLLEPTRRHFDVLAGLLGEVGTGGNLTSDAHIAALAVEHDATIVTYDVDFGRFRGVRWARPEDLV